LLVIGRDVTLMASRGMLETHARSGDDGEAAHFAWPKGRLLVIGALILAGMTAEGVMYDWSVLYLKQDVGMPQALAVLVSSHAWVAFIGFALAGAGLAPVAPILFNAATRLPGVSRAAASASVTSIGYSGFMIGPPLVGSIATATSLTIALGVVVLASALLAYGARLCRRSRRRRSNDARRCRCDAALEWLTGCPTPRQGGDGSIVALPRR
jgi:MFS family permease